MLRLVRCICCVRHAPTLRLPSCLCTRGGRIPLLHGSRGRQGLPVARLGATGHHSDRHLPCPGQAWLVPLPARVRAAYCQWGGLCRVWQWHCWVCYMTPCWDLMCCTLACGVGKATCTGHEPPLPSVEERMGPLECFVAVAAMGWVPSALRLAAMDRHRQTPQVHPALQSLEGTNRVRGWISTVDHRLASDHDTPVTLGPSNCQSSISATLPLEAATLEA
jgi:hypothetical protein